MKQLMVTEATALALAGESWGNETKGETLERLWNTELRYFYLEHFSDACSQGSGVETKEKLESDDEAEASDTR